MTEFIEPTTRFGKLRQFLWFHWHRFFLALIFAGVCWAAFHFAPNRRPLHLWTSVSASSIAHAIHEYATLTPASIDAPQYPREGFDWETLLVQNGLLKHSEIATDRAPPGEPAFFYFPPPSAPFDPASTPLIIENPHPRSSGPLVTVVYYDHSRQWLQGDELWNMLDGRNASDGTTFQRSSPQRASEKVLPPVKPKMVKRVQTLANDMIRLAIERQSQNPSPTYGFPSSTDNWWETLPHDSPDRTEPVVYDQWNYFYIPPIDQPDPKHPRPLIVEAPRLDSLDGVAVAFDDGSAKVLAGESLWANIEGLLAIPDQWGNYPPNLRQEFRIQRVGQ